jgi:hypothetical protein
MKSRGRPIGSKNKVENVTVPILIRLSEPLLKGLTSAAHKCEISRTKYVQEVLTSAVIETLEGEQ